MVKIKTFLSLFFLKILDTLAQICLNVLIKKVLIKKKGVTVVYTTSFPEIEQATNEQVTKNAFRRLSDLSQSPFWFMPHSSRVCSSPLRDFIAIDL